LPTLLLLIAPVEVLFFGVVADPEETHAVWYGMGSARPEPEGRPHPSPLKPGGWPALVEGGQPWAGDRMPFGNCRYMTGTGTFTYRSFWKSERYRKGLSYSGTGRQAGFPGQPVILSVPHPEDLDFI
jgi:hypothetical protein